jgi:hypothetical protein
MEIMMLSKKRQACFHSYAKPRPKLMVVIIIKMGHECKGRTVWLEKISGRGKGDGG